MTVTISGRIGVIGDPVEHSLSPFFQQAAFDFHGLPVRYELLPTPAELIPDRIEQLSRGELYGANVTVPHKERFFSEIDTHSALAQRVGAVNTLVAVGGRVHGDNTDVYGFSAPLIERGFSFGTSRALVIGAGGAARGVVVSLLEAGCREVVVANRTAAKAEDIRLALTDSRLSVLAVDEIATFAADTQLLVNATSLGWQSDQLPCDVETFGLLPAGALVYDLTYRETAFLRAAREHGLDTLDGLPMLVHQGARSFEIWTGLPAPFEVMWTAAVAERDRRAALG